jgi:hypothetical protein
MTVIRVDVRAIEIIDNAEVGRLDISRWKMAHEGRDEWIKEIGTIEFALANEERGVSYILNVHGAVTPINGRTETTRLAIY